MAIKKILISQRRPINETPYTALKEKFGVDITFKQFFLVQPLSSKEFRAQKINILDYTAVVFSSRHAIDAFYGLCEELRVKIPQTMKYFCTTEAVAMYLQKHIIYRKRKIFFGDGTPESIIALIGTKHKDEKFLVAQSESGSGAVLTGLMDERGLEYKTAVFVKSVPQDLKDMDLPSTYRLPLPRHLQSPVQSNSISRSSVKTRWTHFRNPSAFTGRLRFRL